MAAQKGVKRERPAAEVTGEDAATAALAGETPVEDLALSTRVVNALTKAGVATAQDILDMLDGGEKIPGIADRTLEEIRNRLAEKGLLELEDEKADAERKRQTQAEAEQARAETETTLAEATKDGGAERENRQQPLIVPGVATAERRVSFIVRLTVDEQGQPRRTEIQHAQSDNKETFLALDVQRMAAFMKACVRLPVAPETTALPTRPPAKVETPKSEAFTPVSGLTVSDVRVARKGAPGVPVQGLSAGEAFVVQAGFQVQILEAPSLSVQDYSFEVKVFAYEVTSGTSRLLTTHRVALVENVSEYTAQIQAPALSRGLYRLTTLVRLLNMLDHKDGPVVHVTGVRPSDNSTAPQKVALSR
jgi:hypothetical protein